MPRDFATGYRRLPDSDRMTDNPEIARVSLIKTTQKAAFGTDRWPGAGTPNGGPATEPSVTFSGLETFPAIIRLTNEGATRWRPFFRTFAMGAGSCARDRDLR